MNRKLIKLLKQNFKRLKGGELLDCYNQVIVEDISVTITTRVSASNGLFLVNKSKDMLRIRKLTEKECLALMGFTKEDWENIVKQFSTNAIYHVAGDSIVTTCITSLFGSMCNVDYEKAISDYVEKLKGDYE